MRPIYRALTPHRRPGGTTGVALVYGPPVIDSVDGYQPALTPAHAAEKSVVD
jgi:hypothetical protein